MAKNHTIKIIVIAIVQALAIWTHVEPSLSIKYSESASAAKDTKTFEFNFDHAEKKTSHHK
jgi:hypothetical protein